LSRGKMKVMRGRSLQSVNPMLLYFQHRLIQDEQEMHAIKTSCSFAFSSQIYLNLHQCHIKIPPIFDTEFSPMTNFIPIFPLSIVVFPGEELNLHIFEPRYKEMIHDCANSGRHFGIPVVLNNQVNEMGTLIELLEITNTYDNGEMDIRTKGIKVFRMLEVLKSIPDKLYSGAIVNYPENNLQGNRQLMDSVINAVRKLHNLLKVSKEFKKPDPELWTYDLAHHAGLSLEEEYELLQLLHELQRQEYLKRHLLKVLPVVSEMEVLKKRVKMNGHFKNLSGFDI